MSEKASFKKQLLYSGIAFGLIALLFGLWSHYNLNTSGKKQAPDLKSGTAFQIAREIKPFELKNAPTGTPFTNEQLKGHWSMLFFGFTHCALLCPTTLTSLNQFYGNLTDNNVRQLPNVYFISLDPERDSLNRIQHYVTSFNKNFKGATGTEAQLDSVTREFNILFSKANGNNNPDYQIDHSGTVLVINPEGNLVALFSPPIDAKALAEDYQAIIKSNLKGAE